MNHSHTLKLAEAFLEKIDRLLAEVKSDMPLDAMFVMPAEFVYRAANLERVCVAQVKEFVDFVVTVFQMFSASVVCIYNIKYYEDLLHREGVLWR